MAKKHKQAKPNGGEVRVAAIEGEAREAAWKLPAPEGEQEAKKAKKAKPAKPWRYIDELVRLQFELIKLQDWVQKRGLEGRRHLRGPRRGRQRRRHQAHHRKPEPARLPHRGARHADRARARPVVFPALRRRICRRRARSCCSTASWYNRAGVERVMGFCTDEEYHGVPARLPAVRGDADQVGHHPREILVLGKRRGAGAPLPGAHAQPDQALEALAHGHQVARSAGSTTRAPRT